MGLRVTFCLLAAFLETFSRFHTITKLINDVLQIKLVRWVRSLSSGHMDMRRDSTISNLRLWTCSLIVQKVMIHEELIKLAQVLILFGPWAEFVANLRQLWVWTLRLLSTLSWHGSSSPSFQMVWPWVHLHFVFFIHPDWYFSPFLWLLFSQYHTGVVLKCNFAFLLVESRFERVIF